MRLLVEALWNRGIEADGVDLSSYAIGQVADPFDYKESTHVNVSVVHNVVVVSSGAVSIGATGASAWRTPKSCPQTSLKERVAAFRSASVCRHQVQAVTQPGSDSGRYGASSGCCPSASVAQSSGHRRQAMYKLECLP
jgi:hypothetical protein